MSATTLPPLHGFELVRKGCMGVRLPVRKSTPLKFMAMAAFIINVAMQAFLGINTTTSLVVASLTIGLPSVLLYRVWSNKTFTEIEVTASRVAQLENLLGPIKVPLLVRSLDFEYVTVTKVDLPIFAPKTIAKYFGMSESDEWYAISFSDQLPPVAQAIAEKP